jgi:hypothetical protein
VRRPLSLSVVFCLVGALSALSQVRVAERALGKIEPKLSESQPGLELARLVEKNPGADVYVITGTVAVGSNVIDHNKYFYDRTKRLLVFMSRSAMPVGADEFRWRIWRNVTASDFRSGLPYGNATFKSEASPFGRAKETFPLKYPGRPAITAWP